MGEIYKIINKINSKSYIGQTIHDRTIGSFDANKRFLEHVREAKNNISGCRILNNAIRKFGEDNFSIDVLEECSLDELDQKEIFYIKQHNTLFPNGYNIQTGGKKVSIVRQVEN